MGIPFIVKDEIIYELYSPNSRDLIAELALDIDIFDSIKNNVFDKIKEIGQTLSSIDTNDNIVFTLKKIEGASSFSQISSALGLLAEAEDIQYQIINPQPYPTWSWDKLNKVWMAPVEKPEGVSEDSIKWDELSNSWQPTTEKPYDGWIWSWQTQSWTPPIAYPVGAEENEFVWSNELLTWVPNDQTG